MAYVKTTWQNSPSTNTPINATNLNHIEQGIYEAAATADQAESGVEALDPRMDLVEQRLDNLIPEGTPTQGNAELIDIRVGANGITYPDAGSAVRGQVTEIKSALTNIIEKPTNLLNLDNARLGYILSNTGNLSPLEAGATSDYISLKAGTYSYLSKASLYGSGITLVQTYDNNHDFIENITGTADGDVVTFTLSVDTIVRLRLARANIDTAMLVKGSEYPNDYYDYTPNDYLRDNVKVNAENLEGLEEELGNLDFMSLESVETQKVITINNYYVKSDGTQDSNGFSCALTIKSGEKYKIKSKAGSSIRAFVIFNSHNDFSRQYSQDAWNTNHNYDIEITIKDYEDDGTLYVNSISETYIGIKQLDKVTEIDGEYIIDESIPDSKLQTHPTENTLYGKEAVFDGDSICHGASVGQQSPYYEWGWAGRIGTKNNMNWHNVAVSGATITSELYSEGVPRHWVSSYINTIHTNYPNADFIILEGGTNDADLLHGQTENIGSIDPDDWSGSYDNTTYCGALEYLFYNAINLFPKAKIGFIIAPQMGTHYYTKKNRKSFFELAIQACKKWGIPFLNLWEESGLCPNVPSQYTSGQSATNLYTDGQHLTDAGYDFINHKIESWMQTL